jgi:hypothetical protein
MKIRELFNKLYLAPTYEGKRKLMAQLQVDKLELRINKNWEKGKYISQLIDFCNNEIPGEIKLTLIPELNKLKVAFQQKCVELDKESTLLCTKYNIHPPAKKD